MSDASLVVVLAPPGRLVLSFLTEQPNNEIIIGHKVIDRLPPFMSPLVDILFDPTSRKWTGLSYAIASEYSKIVAKICEQLNSPICTFITAQEARRLPQYGPDDDHDHLEIRWLSTKTSQIATAQEFSGWLFDETLSLSPSSNSLPVAVRIENIFRDVIHAFDLTLPNFSFEVCQE